MLNEKGEPEFRLPNKVGPPTERRRLIGALIYKVVVVVVVVLPGSVQRIGGFIKKRHPSMYSYRTTNTADMGCPGEELAISYHWFLPTPYL